MRLPENNVMKTVKINRDELLAIVRENKQKHIAEYEETVEDYKKAAILIAKSNLKLANSGDIKKISQTRTFPALPESYEQSYTRAIRMLELSVEEIIELEQGIFNQLVLDEWQWKGNFSLMASTYKSVSGSL